MNFLSEILESTNLRVEKLKQPETLSKIKQDAASAPTARSFSQALKGSGLSVIAEIKRASPSKGPLRDIPRAKDLARTYEQHGASAVSVLIEPEWFKGSPQDLIETRSAINIPVLYKDFVVADEQIIHARACGADAVLLIAMVSQHELKRQLELCEDLGFEALVECFDERDVDASLTAAAKIIGINQRDLSTFEEYPGAAVRLRDQIGSSAVTVAESAVRSPEEMQTLENAGFDSVLIGEALLRADDPGGKLQELLGTKSASPL